MEIKDLYILLGKIKRKDAIRESENRVVWPLSLIDDTPVTISLEKATVIFDYVDGPEKENYAFIATDTPFLLELTRKLVEGIRVFMGSITTLRIEEDMLNEDLIICMFEEDQVYVGDETPIDLDIIYGEQIEASLTLTIRDICLEKSCIGIRSVVSNVKIK